MGRRKRNRNGNFKQDIAKRPKDIPDYFRMLYEQIVNDPSDFIVPPLNPPGFGFQRPELLYVSPLVTGEILFDDPFYTVKPPPPLGPDDPTYPQWLKSVEASAKRIEACQPGKETPACARAREASYAATREYARALDRTYGLNRLQELEKKLARGNGSSAAAASLAATEDAAKYAALMEEAKQANARIIRIRRKRTRT
ncbi:MAG: hypothetical protein ACXVDJ_04545 [Tumebacillaceae bacterium]